jgi:hypothetical protein
VAASKYADGRDAVAALDGNTGNIHVNISILVNSSDPGKPLLVPLTGSISY